MPEPGSDRRIVLTLHKPRVGWYPKPTVVFEDRGHPAQWGSGTWQIRGDGPTRLGVFLYNRLWRFGEASILIEPDGPSRLTYRAPWLPFLPGRLRVEA